MEPFPPATAVDDTLRTGVDPNESGDRQADVFDR